jgi:branched-chain amino acid aminotransferase
MYVCEGDARRDPVWSEGEIVPLGEVPLSPAAAILSYGLGVFEGLKAERDARGRLLLFRAADHVRRLRASAERLLLPPFPLDQGVRAIEGLVRRNAAFVPERGAGAFYVRPMLHCVEPILGGRAGARSRMLIYGCPVGPVFPPGAPLRLRVADAARCAPGGTGGAKAVGNYATALATVARCRSLGFDDALFLDARAARDVTETSGANVFARLSRGEVVTPRLTDEILPGITRESCIALLAREHGIRVEERTLPLAELLESAVEVFCTGTGLGVRSAGAIHDGKREVRFRSTELAAALAERMAAIRGGAEEPFGWVSEISG